MTIEYIIEPSNHDLEEVYEVAARRVGRGDLYDQKLNNPYYKDYYSQDYKKIEGGSQPGKDGKINPPVEMDRDALAAAESYEKAKANDKPYDNLTADDK